MKKTLTANISGMVFYLDEDAYNKLGAYLSTLRRHFSKEEGSDEIVSGIEGRIAEMFDQKVSGQKEVISIGDVDEIIRQLGEPAQISQEEPGERKPSEPEYAGQTVNKRLYRDPDDRYIGGVCGGMGAFFNIDPTWIRVAFLLALFMSFGLLLYIILWIVIPMARTTAEKLEMRGEAPNLSNIERSIREEMEGVKGPASTLEGEETEKVYRKRVKSNANEFFSVLFKIIAIIVGLVILLVGLVLLVGFLFSLFGGPVNITLDNRSFLFNIPSALETYFISPRMVVFATVALLLSLGIPFLVLIYIGAMMAFQFKSSWRYLGPITFILWLTGLILLFFVMISGVRHYRAQKPFSVSPQSGFIKYAWNHKGIETTTDDQNPENIYLLSASRPEIAG